MTQQEQFEADYRKAFPISVEAQPSLFEKDVNGEYGNIKACAAFGVWLQQAKRHEVEIAELVAASDEVLERLKASLECKEWAWDSDQRECAEFSVRQLSDTIAKYEVKK